MHRSEKGSLVFYQSEAIEQFANVTQAVTTRHGGVSSAPFHTLNLSSTVGDDPGNVRENWKRLHATLELDAWATVDAHQAQANQVACVTAGLRGSRVLNVDALITHAPGLPLLLRFADCVPVLFYAPKQRAVGIAHAGWRGTVGKVVTNTVQAMCEAFGVEPRDLVACVGPSIGPCCYEIGTDVQAKVEAAFPDTKHLLLHQNGATHLDLWEANAQQLRELGVGQIEVAGICTADHTDDLYSWRGEHAHTGRFAAVIALNS
jgi:purine-nucleoside/S-methyl-5'-thioadenosine phosphorylase / adenosine deaminase